jgi:hypothetical protein
VARRCPQPGAPPHDAQALALRHEVDVVTREENPFAADRALRHDQDPDDPRVTLYVVNMPRLRDRCLADRFERHFGLPSDASRWASEGGPARAVVALRGQPAPPASTSSRTAASHAPRQPPPGTATNHLHLMACQGLVTTFVKKEQVVSPFQRLPAVDARAAVEVFDSDGDRIGSWWGESARGRPPARGPQDHVGPVGRSARASPTEGADLSECDESAPGRASKPSGRPPRRRRPRGWCPRWRSRRYRA